MRPSVRWLKGAVSAAFFLVLLRWMRRHDIGAHLRGADPIFLAASFMIVPVMVSASCLKWQVLLRAQGHRVPFRSLMAYYLVGYYFSNLLPSMVGGDVVRWLYAGRHIGSLGHAAASVFLERVTGIVFLLAMVVVLPALNGGLYRHPAIWIPAVGAIGLLASMVVAMSLPARARSLATAIADRLELASPSAGTRSAGRLRRWAVRGLRKADSFFDRVAAGWAVLRRDRRVLAQVVMLTLAFYALAVLNVWLAFRTFGPAPSPAHILAVLPTALTVAMIPITLGSLGITETSYVFYFGLLGVSAGHTGLMALFLRAKLILVGLVGGAVYVLRGHPVRPVDATAGDMAP